MSFSLDFSNVFSVLKQQPMERKLYSIIGKEQIDDGNFDPAVINPNEDYFTLRLCEMYLTDSREYFRTFLPMAILVSDFKYDKARQTVPFFLDSKMLGLEAYLQGAYVEFRNTRVAGPFPYVGDDVALFTGLFRLEASNLAIQLFNLFENVLNSFDLCGLSQYLSATKSLGQNLTSILKMKECEFRLGARDVYTETDDAPNRFRQSYIAYVNCPEHTYKAGELCVKDNRLYSNNAEPVTNYDYCLMKIERSDTRNDYTSFEFYSLWEDATYFLIANELDKADLKIVECLQSINKCPDLTKGQKFDLTLNFEVDYKNERSKRTGGGESQDGSYRDSRGTGIAVRDSVSTSLQSSAVMADKLMLPTDVGAVLDRLKDEWRSIPYLDRADKKFREFSEGQDEAKKNDLINQQLAVIKKIRIKDSKEVPDPSSLVEALVFTTLR